MTLYNWYILTENRLLLFIILTLFGGIIPMFFFNKKNVIFIKNYSLTLSLIIFVLSSFLWILFDNSATEFQFYVDLPWIPLFNLYFSLGIDGISLFFFLLTAFLIPICILASWESIQNKEKEYFITLLIIELLLLNSFAVLDILLFYIFFESILIPMFILIGIWGSRRRKIHAAYLFFFYTLLGSVLMLLGILLIYYITGTTDLKTIIMYNFNNYTQLILWLSFFFSFAVKVPMIPVHIWLPEAHVEAPTAGSVILAGILLKLGTYGLLRFSLPLFPYATAYFAPLVFTMSVIAIIYASCTTIRQIDLKKIIAYSSVAHMNFVTIGIFALNLQGLEGSLLLMLGHGFVSSALFLCIGVLYDRYKTRLLYYYGGLAQVMPIFTIIFFFFTIANISFPGTSNFVGELLILLGIFQINTVTTILAAIGVILGAVYAIWLYNRVVFGSLKNGFFHAFLDVTRREFHVFVSLIIPTLIVGIYPSIVLNSCTVSLFNLLQV